MWMGCAERFPFVHTSHPSLSITHHRTNVRTQVCGSGLNSAGASRSHPPPPPPPNRRRGNRPGRERGSAAQRSGDSPISGNTAIQQYSFRAVHLTCICDACTHLGGTAQRTSTRSGWPSLGASGTSDSLRGPGGAAITTRAASLYGMSVLVLANPVRDELLKDGVHRGAGRRGRELEPEM